jgi:hypothetical protein
MKVMAVHRRSLGRRNLELKTSSIKDSRRDDSLPSHVEP